VEAIAGAGLLKGMDLVDSGAGITTEIMVGVVVAAITGYAAIAFLLRLIGRTGLAPFGIYCMVAGVVALLVV
jgi:undecaprenyl-diphosphatase